MKDPTSKTPIFRGENIELLLKDLEKHETESGLFSNLRKDPIPVFLIGQSQAIICSYFDRMISYKAWRKAISNSFPVYRIFKPVGYTRSNAQILRVKNHVIAFYPKPNLVCKFGRHSGIRSSDSLAREVKAIRSAKLIGSFSTPEIILENTTGNSPVIWFEKINGEAVNYKNREFSSLHFLKVLIPWYEANGVRFEKPDIRKLAGDMNYDRLISYGWKEDESELILKALEKISEMDSVMPVSLIHGDATAGNYFLDRNKNIIILDWEQSRTDYIIYDVYSLSQSGGDAVKQVFTKWLKTYSNNGSAVIDVDIQISIFEISSNLDCLSEEMYLRQMLSTGQIRQNFRIRKQIVLSAVNKILNVLK